MKRIFTAITLFFAALAVSGQSLHILRDKADVTSGIITVPVTQGQHVQTPLSIFNSTGNTISYQVNRTILNPPMNDTCAALYFCSGKTCYLPNSSVTWTPNAPPSTITPHDTMSNGNGVVSYYDVCPDVCNDLYVRYRIYNTEANTTDTAHVDIRYMCISSIQKLSKIRGYISDAYPNPASSSFSIAYRLSSFSMGEIIMNNIWGKEVVRIKLHDQEDNITVGTEILPPGIYFYSLAVNNSKIITKKVIIQ